MRGVVLVVFWKLICFVFISRFCGSSWLILVTVLIVLTLNLLTTTIVAPPSNDSKWQMGFNSAFKGLIPRYWLSTIIRL